MIEVNVQPAPRWDELVEQTTTLYEEAHQARLTTEKFMLDGRHTGTGGGNHFVLGGATAADSPFLRRPDLLRSLIAYWHNHPSLSYLFSGLFIGPTSQAPRVDEARHDSVYELEIAFAQLPAAGDRRAAVAGRSRCSATCWWTSPATRIAPSSASTSSIRPTRASGPPRAARAARVRDAAARAHEPRAAAAAARARRALLARRRTRRRSSRWGTELHDRFMLPYFVWLDFDDVIEELRAQRLRDSTPAWFAPHFEFRFPLAGEIAARGDRT